MRGIYTTSKDVQEMRRLRNEGRTNFEIANLMNISYRTVIRNIGKQPSRKDLYSLATKINWRLKMNNCDLIFAVGGAILGGLTVFGIIKDREMKKLDEFNERFNREVKKLSKLTYVDVGDDIIEAASEEAVNREVGKVIRRISNNIEKDAEKKIRLMIGDEVKRTSDSIREKVSDEISKQASRIDEGLLKKQIVEKAKEAVVEKFEGALDSQLDEFNRNLKNVSNIYESIANSVTQNRNTKPFNVSFG